MREIRRADLVEALELLDKEDDINKVMLGVGMLGRTHATAPGHVCMFHV